jgi:IclR helix-turn-helix domain
VRAGGEERGRGAKPIAVELSRAQIDQVVRAAGDGGALSVLLGGLADFRDVFSQDTDARRLMDDPRLSRSLLLGLLVLATLPADGSYLQLREIVKLMGMNTSTTHRYLSTLVAAGLVERDPTTRRYRLALGPGAPDNAGG